MLDTKVYTMIGPIIAALITGLVALIGLIISKESKLSEFRQAWIDQLRDDIAELLSILLYIKELSGVEEVTDIEKKEIYQGLVKADKALFLVRLRLNDLETEASALLETLQKIEDYSNQGDYPEDPAIQLEKELIDRSKVVLKLEWKRVKKGEPVFRHVKLALYALITILLFALVIQVV